MKYITLGLVSAIMLLFANVSMAASLTATYTATPQADNTVTLNVTITNTGADGIYSAVLTPTGMLTGTPAVNLGDFITGGSTSFQLPANNDPGYLMFTASGLDALGNTITFDVMGAGQ